MRRDLVIRRHRRRSAPHDDGACELGAQGVDDRSILGDLSLGCVEAAIEVFSGANHRVVCEARHFALAFFATGFAAGFFDEGFAAPFFAVAVGAVAVHRVRATHLASWGAYAHLWYVCTLVVASAINVDEWRVALVAAGREADRGAVYTSVIRTVEARALRDIGRVPNVA